MDALYVPFALFVQQPLRLALVAVLFAVAAYLAGRTWGDASARWLYVTAGAWLLWCLWEGALLVFSPGANIRVDLLLIIPVVLVLSLVGVVQAARLRP
jgi:hypothetical protein